MARGKLTISIDLELAWGWWDILTPEILQMSERAERSICTALLARFDRYHVPVTFAIVAALLDPSSSRSRPGNQSSWYAPDIIERILAAKVVHEIGSHGGMHVYFDALTPAAALEDLAYAKNVHCQHRLPFRSWVFPRNAVGHLEALAQVGLRTFRGPDAGWTRLATRAGLERIAGPVDKLLPLPPHSVVPRAHGALIDIPGSMLLPGRNGVRRFIFPEVTRMKLRLGLARARRTGETFHLWFHPCNFYYRREEQLETLSWFLEHAANEASHGRIELCTMGSYADGKVQTSQRP
jgi:hypothetical protein